MAYRLIRFGQNKEVVLDQMVEAPNSVGDNELWAQETGGTAWLLAGKQGWYMLRTKEMKAAYWTTWIMKPDSVPLPKYIQMLELTGAL